MTFAEKEYSEIIYFKTLVSTLSPIGALIRRVEFKYDTFVITVLSEDLYKILFFCKNHKVLGFKTLIDIVATDLFIYQYRFSLSYCLLSLIGNTRLIVTCDVADKSPVETVTPLFRSANWSEREIWDLFGVVFMQHPDLRRILTDYGFTGHPLRKDYLTIGSVEIFYNLFESSVDYRAVSLPPIFLKMSEEFNFWEEPEKNEHLE